MTRREQIYLRNRHGFVRLAAETGATLVPVYAFGHTRLFDQLAGADGWMASVSRLMRGSLTLFWGRWFLPIPYKTKLTIAFGKLVPPGASLASPHHPLPIPLSLPPDIVAYMPAP